MPKIVDQAARRAELAEAVWRVVVRDGLDHASVRRVAQEAGLSTGSLRYFFATQSELLDFTLALVGERLSARIGALDRSGDQRQVVTAMIEEMLPLDADRRAECEVWLAFAARSLVDQTLATRRADIDEQLTESFRIMMGLLAADGVLRPGLDPEIEAQRLYALVDGLILHAVLQGPTGTDAVTVVQAHLDEIAPLPQPGRGESA